MDNILPGRKEAEQLGYTLFCYSGDKSCATYCNGQLGLTVNKNGNASLSAQYMLVELSIKNFSFPNINFNLFEKQINDILNNIGV